MHRTRIPGYRFSHGNIFSNFGARITDFNNFSRKYSNLTKMKGLWFGLTVTWNFRFKDLVFKVILNVKLSGMRFSERTFKLVIIIALDSYSIQLKIEFFKFFVGLECKNSELWPLKFFRKVWNSKMWCKQYKRKFHNRISAEILFFTLSRYWIKGTHSTLESILDYIITLTIHALLANLN